MRKTFLVLILTLFLSLALGLVFGQAKAETVKWRTTSYFIKMEALVKRISIYCDLLIFDIEHQLR